MVFNLDLEKFRKAKIAVIGDIMLDIYTYCTSDRLSPEAPVPVAKFERDIYELGGSANVAANISALGGNACLFGYTGNDKEREILDKKLKDRNIKSSLYPVLNETIQKNRIVVNNQQQLVRIDKESFYTPEEKIEKKIIESILEYSPDVIVASDYAKGALTNNIFNLLKETGLIKKVIVDPKPKNKENYKGVYLITPNTKEAKEMSGLENIEEIGKKLQYELGSSVLLTRGKDGMTLFENSKSYHLPTQAKTVYNVVGAGDTVIATLALGISSGFSLEHSAFLANHAAGIVVEKEGTATLSRSELEEVVNSEHRKYKTLNQLKNIREDLKRKGKRVVFTSGCYDILHPGHTSLLKTAKSYGDVLILAINADKSPFFKLKGNSRPVLNEKERVSLLSSLESVDYITIFEEDTPIKIIKELMPDIKIKGGEYIEERVAEEDSFIKSYGGESKYLPRMSNHSTTKLIDKIRNGNKE
ncbi:MAG: PfkB family carbohydrate kinase [Candidatus Nanoarchaeia archaeon]